MNNDTSVLNFRELTGEETKQKGGRPKVSVDRDEGRTTGYIKDRWDQKSLLVLNPPNQWRGKSEDVSSPWRR